MNIEKVEGLAKQVNNAMAGQPFKFEEFVKLMGKDTNYCKQLMTVMTAYGYIAVASKFQNYIRYKVVMGEDRKKLLEERIKLIEKDINLKQNMLNDMRKMV